MVSSWLMESFSYTCCHLGAVFTSCVVIPQVSLPFGDADLSWVWEWMSIVSHHSTLVREEPKLRTP